MSTTKEETQKRIENLEKELAELRALLQEQNKPKSYTSPAPQSSRVPNPAYTGRPFDNAPGRADTYSEPSHFDSESDRKLHEYWKNHPTGR